MKDVSHSVRTAFGISSDKRYHFISFHAKRIYRVGDFPAKRVLVPKVPCPLVCPSPGIMEKDRVIYKWITGIIGKRSFRPRAYLNLEKGSICFATCKAYN